MRKFNGKQFKKIASFLPENEAETLASRKRKKGYYARTVPRYEGRGTHASDTDYDVYVSITKKVKSKRKTTWKTHKKN